MDIKQPNEEKLAELIGILLGDGSLCLTENRPTLNNRLKISFNSRYDSDYIFYVKQLLIDLFDTEPILKYRKGENTADLFIFKKPLKFIIYALIVMGFIIITLLRLNFLSYFYYYLVLSVNISLC